MDPSEVREVVLRDHVILKHHLRALENAVEAMHVEPSKQVVIVELACGLLSALIAHTEYEDAVLAPALRELDAWGSIRATMLLEHHASQRKQLADLAEMYVIGSDPEQVAQRTLAWIHDVQTDMVHEESSVLSLLRDDLVAVAAESG